MPRKKTIDISKLSQAQQDEAMQWLDKVEAAEHAKEAIRSKEAIKFYYDVKEELEEILIDKLSKQPSKDDNGKAITIVSPLAARAAGDNGWSFSKILKLIANMPNRKPTTDEGYIKAASNIEIGKKRKLSDEAKAKKAATAKERVREEARGVMFKKDESDRKKAATAKKKKAAKPKHKSAGAMAVGSDGLTKHQRYEANNRERSPEQIAEKNEKRRIRRANGNKD